MTWHLFAGDGRKDSTGNAWAALPAPPPWRDREVAITRFVISDDLRDAVNAALHLRRPLLLTGAPGSGKSTLIHLIAEELSLAGPLTWHITSRSTLIDGLFQYDALGRLHASQSAVEADGEDAARVEDYVTLGPLGTALADQHRPRAVLIDEIDKSDFDLPGDLLNVLEEGEFDVPPLVRDARGGRRSGGKIVHEVRGFDRGMYEIKGGLVRRTHWPVIVMTSNGARSFPPPFLRRCVRFEMPTPQQGFLANVVDGYIANVEGEDRAKIEEFARRLLAGEQLAIDQLLNFLHIVSSQNVADTTRELLERMLLEELSGR